MPEYIKRTILNNLQVFYIYIQQNDLHHFSIFYNLSIFSCVAYKIFHIYFQVCINDLLSKQSEQSCIRVSRVSEWSKAGRDGVRKIGREGGREEGRKEGR